MNKYEFALKQEILLEKGSAVLADLFHYKRQHQIIEKTHPVSALYSLIWSAKQDILLAKTESELAEIEEEFDAAARLLTEFETDSNEQGETMGMEDRPLMQGGLT